MQLDLMKEDPNSKNETVGELKGELKIIYLIVKHYKLNFFNYAGNKIQETKGNNIM